MLPALNLLSPNEKKESQRVKVFLFLNEIILLVFIFIVLGGAALLTARMMLEKKFQEMTLAQIPGSSKIASLQREIQITNRKLSQLNHITTGTHSWTPLILELIKLTPSSIRWDSFALKAAETVTLRGTAQTRIGLSEFKKNLELSPLISSVDLPLQYLLGTTNIEFVLGISLTKASLSPL